MENVVSLHSLLRIESIIGDPLAQLVEHNTFNVGVLGSSPKRITPRKRGLSQDKPLFSLIDLYWPPLDQCGVSLSLSADSQSRRNTTTKSQLFKYDCAAQTYGPIRNEQEQVWAAQS